jgi:hypothetical protein
MSSKRNNIYKGGIAKKKLFSPLLAPSKDLTLESSKRI